MPAPFSKKSISENDLLDLHGKVAIVTGGNTGVGYGTVQFLVRKGAKVYIAGRSEERVAAAIKQLEAEGIEDGSVHLLKIDLSNPRSVTHAVEEFVSKEKRLDILVNNAAVGATGPYNLTSDGLFDIVATNHIGHFAFTDGLLPLLKSTALEAGSDVRIVNVSSNAHERVHPDSFAGKDNVNKNYGDSFNGYLDTYGLTKLANLLHIKELQRKLDLSGVPIVCIAVHPGSVGTDGANQFLKNLPYIGGFLVAILGKLLLGSWRKGAMSSAFAAAGKDVAQDKARFKAVYLTPVARISDPTKEGQDERLAKELWETTESILKDIGA